jgi:hypothetical protein
MWVTTKMNNTGKSRCLSPKCAKISVQLFYTTESIALWSETKICSNHRIRRGHSIGKTFLYLCLYWKLRKSSPEPADQFQPCIKGIQICSNKGPHRLQRGNNYKHAKIEWVRHLKFFFKNHSQKSSDLQEIFLTMCKLKFNKIMVPGCQEGLQ